MAVLPRSLVLLRLLGALGSLQTEPVRPIIFLNTTEGAELMKNATHSRPFWSMGPQMQTQWNDTCAQTSVALLLNALSWQGLPAPGTKVPEMVHHWDHVRVVSSSPCARDVAASTRASNVSEVLPKLAALVECAGAEAKAVFAKAVDAARFREDVMDSFAASPFRPIVVNFERKRLAWTGPVIVLGAGHYSPLGAYDAATDRVLILDTARLRFDAWWVGLEDLFTAMVQGDMPYSEQGYIVARLPEAHHGAASAPPTPSGGIMRALLGVLGLEPLGPARPLVYLDTDEGADLLRAATHSQPFWQIGVHLNTQHDGLSAHVTATVLLNALGRQGLPAPFTTMFGGTKTPRHWEKFNLVNSSACAREVGAQWAGRLSQVAAVIECAGAEAKAVRARTTDAASFRRDLVGSFSASPLRFVAVNFERRWLGQGPTLMHLSVGHYSPVGAYDAATDRVLVLDLARMRFQPWWAGLEDLFEAMRQPDGPDSEHGYLIAQMPQSSQSTFAVCAQSTEGCGGAPGR